MADADQVSTEEQLEEVRCFSKEFIKARVVLGILSFFGFFVNYMLRVNMNIAIVSMTPSASGITNKTIINECIETTNLTLQDNSIIEEAEFIWNAYEQAIVLGSFYWGYIISPIPGGMLAERYGTKIIYGGANLLSGLMALLTPVAARYHFSSLIIIRVLQGLASGMTWPAMHVMTSKWIPPHERSKFVATYIGNSVGTAVTFPLCGLLIDILGSWVWAFYVPAVLCIIWCIFWYFFAYDSPSQHPRISQKEKEYIHSYVSQHLSGKKKFPWSKVLKSVPVWALFIANIGCVWGFMTITAYSPTYFKTVHGFGIRANGYLSALPSLSRFIMAMSFSSVMDYFIKNGKFSVTCARKIATSMALFLPAILCLFMGRVGCNPIAEVIILTLLTALTGCSAAGTTVNSVDLAPNFSGTLLGIIMLGGMSSGFVAPLFVSYIIQYDESITQWRYVFGTIAGINVIAAIVFLIGGSGEVQSWNNINNTKKQKREKNTE